MVFGIDDIDSCDSLSLGVLGVCDSTSKKNQINFLVAALDPALTACLDIIAEHFTMTLATPNFTLQRDTFRSVA
jgi:hypothetical protein